MSETRLQVTVIALFQESDLCFVLNSELVLFKVPFFRVFFELGAPFENVLVSHAMVFISLHLNLEIHDLLLKFGVFLTVEGESAVVLLLYLLDTVLPPPHIFLIIFADELVNDLFLLLKL